MTRTGLVAGNWKMHGNRAANAALLDAILRGQGGDASAECAVCVPFPYLAQVGERLRGTAVAWGAQNLSEHAQGAYTGEVSAAMLADFGCKYVIVGHSERRQLFRESDEQVAAKIAAARKGGLTPIVCVGETLEERESGGTATKVTEQVQRAFDGIDATTAARSVVAYEPIWAIGTGRNAEPTDAGQVVEVIRATIAERVSSEVAEAVRVLYGGSVKPGNIREFMAHPEIDGALVGGASLDPESLALIARYR
jgi:triosephosphate isomerase